MNPYIDYYPGDTKRPFAKRFIDVILDAQHEVTPTFFLRDIHGPGHGSNRLVAHASRTTKVTTAVQCVLDGCLIYEDGELLQHRLTNGKLADAWHQIQDKYIDLSTSERSEINQSYTGVENVAYRIRYKTNVTIPINVVIPTAYRGT